MLHRFVTKPLLAPVLVTVIAACVGFVPRSARAGPPLIADDPNTVGPGVVQPIFSFSVFSQGDATFIQSPILDLTVGIVDTLDATLVTTLGVLVDRGRSPPIVQGGLLTPGLKWEFLRTKRGRFAFSPALTIDIHLPDAIFGLLPVQGELSIGTRGSVIGFDVGYLPIRNREDGWFVVPYGTYAATRKLNVLFELWVLSPGPPVGLDINFGASVGIDYGISGKAVRLLASVGTGIVSIGGPRVSVRAYLGVQYTLGRRRR